MNGVLRKYWHLIVVLAGAIIAFALIYVLRNAVLPFLVGLVLVYLLSPVVNWVEKHLLYRNWWVNRLEGRRVTAIMLVNAGMIGIFGLFGFYAFNTVVYAFSTLLQDAQGHWVTAVAILQQWTDGLRQLVPLGIREQIDIFAVDVGSGITSMVQSRIQDGIAQVPTAFGTMLGLAVLPLFLFYILKDREELSRSFYSAFPPWAARHIQDISQIIENVLGRYVRATLTLGFSVFLLTLAGLLIVRAPLAPLLAVVAGVAEMIPALGPWIGGAIAVVVTLALAPEKVAFVVVIALGVQLLENNLLVPRIQGGYLGIHPAIAIVLLVAGGVVAGLWGMLLAVPLAATAVQLYRYVRDVTCQEKEAEELLLSSSEKHGES
ncbi:MAG: AI-2E family transporter [Chloroflexi bacterium]|nr:AI-2E family transporter [Chloroflexota bacterium]